jgi:hypothetical protein
MTDRKFNYRLFPVEREAGVQCMHLENVGTKICKAKEGGGGGWR